MKIHQGRTRQPGEQADGRKAGEDPGFTRRSMPVFFGVWEPEVGTRRLVVDEQRWAAARIYDPVLDRSDLPIFAPEARP